MIFLTNCKINPKGTGFDLVSKAFEEDGNKLSILGFDAAKKLVASQDVDDEALKAMFDTALSQKKPVLFYIHGFNNSFEEMVDTSARLERLYGVQVIGYHWPSEGFPSSGLVGGYKNSKIQTYGDDILTGGTSPSFIRGVAVRYALAKVNAQLSATALNRAFKVMASACENHPQHRLSMAVHSLGVEFLKNTTELEGATSYLKQLVNVVLLAPCTNTNGHAGFLGQLQPKKKVYVTYANNDNILLAAKIADGHVKLGADIGGSIELRVRYVRFLQSAAAVTGAHSYFAVEDIEVSQSFFKRVFSAGDDSMERGYKGEYAAVDYTHAYIGYEDERMPITKTKAKKRT